MNAYLRRFLGITLALLVMLGATQCAPAPGKPTTAAGPTEAPKPAEATAPPKEPIRFAVIGPYTGDAASYGDMSRRAIQLAADEINAAGGITGRKVVLEFFDDRCDSKEAANVAQKIVADGGYWASLGPMCSSCTLAVMPIFEEAGLTCLVGSSANPAVTRQGWKHIFRTVVSDDQNGPFLVEMAVKDLGAKRLATIYAQDDWGRGFQDTMKPTAEKLGAQVVASEAFIPGTDKDFKAQLTRIAEAKPDAFLVLAYSTEAGMIAQQRVGTPLEKVPMLLTGSAQDEYFLKLAGDAANGALFQVLYDPFSTEPISKAFNDKWFAKFKELPGEMQAYNYDLLYIVKAAIEAGATQKDLNDYVRKVEYNGVSGLTKFDATGDQIGKRPKSITVENGKWKSYVPTEQ